MARFSGPDAVTRVELLQWPRDASRRDTLADAGRPRLLLVPVGVRPPVVSSKLEDWLRVPADERDVFVRMSHLISRAGCVEVPATLVDGVLDARDARVVLTPLEARLIVPLLTDVGRVVARGRLVESVWPTGDGNDRGLAVLVSRVRRKIAHTELTLASVRSRGYVLTERGHA